MAATVNTLNRYSSENEKLRYVGVRSSGRRKAADAAVLWHQTGMLGVMIQFNTHTTESSRFIPIVCRHMNPMYNIDTIAENEIVSARPLRPIRPWHVGVVCFKLHAQV